MPRYLVKWAIDVLDVDTPEEAAREAWRLMRKLDSIANVFDVVDQAGNVVAIDLDDPEETAFNLATLGDVLRKQQEGDRAHR